MTYSPEEVAEIADALAKGEDAAKALKVGDEFRGAWPAADEAGYTRGSLGHRLFTAGFLQNCPQVYTAHDSNRIVKLEPKS